MYQLALKKTQIYNRKIFLLSATKMGENTINILTAIFLSKTSDLCRIKVLWRISFTAYVLLFTNMTRI